MYTIFELINALWSYMPNTRGNLFVTFAFSISYFSCMNIWMPKGCSYFTAMTRVSIYWIHNSFMVVTENNCNIIKGEFIAGNKTEIKHSKTPKAFQINCSYVWCKAFWFWKKKAYRIHILPAKEMWNKICITFETLIWLYTVKPLQKNSNIYVDRSFEIVMPI